MFSHLLFLARQSPAPGLAGPEHGSPAGPWLLVAAVVLVVDTAAATVLFALHFPVASVLYLIGGAAGVAMTTIGYLYPLLTKNTDAMPGGSGKWRA